MAARTVLIVDDDPVILRLLRVNFELEGFAVISAENGNDAVAMATRDLPDIILLDVMMPGMDGIETAKVLRAQTVTEGIPIVFCSAKAQTVDIDAGLGAGGLAYVTKPFDPIELVGIIEDLLPERRPS